MTANYAEIVGTWIIRGVYIVWSSVETCLFSRSPVYESLAWSLYDASGYSQHAQTFHELDVSAEESVCVLHHVQRKIGMQQVDKIAVHHVGTWRTSYELPDLFAPPPPAWLFIGYGIHEDVLVDCTESMHALVVYDNHITPDILTIVEPDSRGKTWYYIDPKTFEQRVFPDGGILIDEDPSPVSLPVPVSEPEAAPVPTGDAESKKDD
jgi:hypothetical protein